jgi:hypothetical protein
MNSELKYKYRIIRFLLILACCALAALSAWAIYVLLASILSVEIDAPFKVQKNDILLLLGFVFSFVSMYILSAYILLRLISRKLGWSRQQKLAVLLKDKWPEHWYKCENT